jgi:histidinol-phosphate phosphatase family protein
MRPAIFIDKDHTLIPDIPYNVDPERITLTPGAGEALCRLQAAGYALVVVSNQSGVARGLFPVSALVGVEEKVRQLLAPYGVALDGFFFCPHHPEGNTRDYAIDCSCRKPLPGLLYRASRILELDLTRSWMVGDIWSDMAAGRAAGCRTILFTYHTELARELPRSFPDHTAATFDEAATLILAHAQAAESGPSVPTLTPAATRKGSATYRFTRRTLARARA